MNVVFSRRTWEAFWMCTALAIFFYVVTIVAYQTWAFWYLLTNLILAYIPLALTYPLVGYAGRYGWVNWRTILAGGVWLVFLPNSFYEITDFIHLLRDTHGLDPMFGAIMLCLFSGLGMAAGFMSVWAVHRQLLRRLSFGTAYVMVEFTILSSSVAIYLGRTLRWNSWDVILQPLGIARDVVLNLVVEPSRLAAGTIVMFFVVLSVLYAAIWRVFGASSGSER